MPIPDPFTAVALSAGVITNLATDILKHRSQYIKNPLMARALKWAGFREAEDLEERILKTLTEALTIYFESHQAYQIQGIVEFFKQPSTAQQIADYIIDGKQIDQPALQASLEQSLGQQAVAPLLIKKRSLDREKIVPDFLESYQKALNRQLSIPQMALMSKLLELGQQLEELKASEDRLKKFIAASLEEIEEIEEINAPQSQQKNNLVSPSTETAEKAANCIRWLHLSDFHTGKDNYGQR